jgi:sugar/nucleoside kinase (ribokinase family)
VELRVPTGGGIGSIIDVLVGLTDTGVGTGPTFSSGGTSTATPELLEASLTALRAGHIEFIVLDDGPRGFQQVTGEGDGPYWLQRFAAPDAEPAEPIGGVDAGLAAQAMHAYLAGTADPPELEWSVPAAAPTAPPRRRWFRR